MMVLKVYDRAELQVLQGPSRGTYVTQIADVGPDSFKVALPRVAGRDISVLAGDLIRCRIHAEGALYQMECRVLARELTPVPMLVLRLVGTVQKVQRRDFHRLKVNLPLLYSPVVGLDGNSRGESRRTRLTDLSGGGCAALLLEPMSPGALLHLFLLLPPETEIYATAEVVRVDLAAFGPGYLTGLRFVSIAERDRDEIIRYIFRAQRERRRRGLP